MLSFVLQKTEKIKRSVVGLWQHAGLGRRISSNDEPLDYAPRVGSPDYDPEGIIRMELTGRDVPARSSAATNIDYSEEREVTGFLDQFENVPGVGRDIQVATTGIKLDGSAPTVDAPPPTLGQHNSQIWSELGLSPEDIEKLAKDGAI